MLCVRRGVLQITARTLGKSPREGWRRCCWPADRWRHGCRFGGSCTPPLRMARNRGKSTGLQQAKYTAVDASSMHPLAVQTGRNCSRCDSRVVHLCAPGLPCRKASTRPRPLRWAPVVDNSGMVKRSFELASWKASMKNLYLLEPVCDDPRFELLTFDSGDERELPSILGRSSLRADLDPSSELEQGVSIVSLKDNWITPRTVGKLRTYNDFPTVYRAPGFSPRAVEALADLLEGNGELGKVRDRLGTRSSKAGAGD